MDYRALFVHAEYQCLNYDYFTIGLGYQPKRNFTHFVKKHPRLSFRGYTVNYSKKIQNSDWGLSFQTAMYAATFDGPMCAGLELNYKSVNLTDHFGCKPMVGLSFPIVSIMYGYNIDFYTVKSERLNQNELIISARLPLYNEKKFKRKK